MIEINVTRTLDCRVKIDSSVPFFKPTTEFPGSRIESIKTGTMKRRVRCDSSRFKRTMDLRQTQGGALERCDHLGDSLLFVVHLDLLGRRFRKVAFLAEPLSLFLLIGRTMRVALVGVPDPGDPDLAFPHQRACYRNVRPQDLVSCGKPLRRTRLVGPFRLVREEQPTEPASLRPLATD